MVPQDHQLSYLGSL